MPWGCCHRRDLHPKKHPGGIQPPPRPGVGGGDIAPSRDMHKRDSGQCCGCTPPPKLPPPPPSSSQGFSPHRSIPNPISRNGGSPGGGVWGGGVGGGAGVGPCPCSEQPRPGRVPGAGPGDTMYRRPERRDSLPRQPGGGGGGRDRVGVCVGGVPARGHHTPTPPFSIPRSVSPAPPQYPHPNISPAFPSHPRCWPAPPFPSSPAFGGI